MKINTTLSYLTCLLCWAMFAQNAAAQVPSFGKGFYRLTVDSLKDGKSLDVINDGKNDKLQMAKTGNFTGQYWQITAVNEGQYRFTTQWLGAKKALAVVIENEKMLLRMVDVTNNEDTYQLWNIEPVQDKKGFYLINNVSAGMMVPLTLDKKGLGLVYKEPIMPSQHWKITSIDTKK